MTPYKCPEPRTSRTASPTSPPSSARARRPRRSPIVAANRKSSAPAPVGAARRYAVRDRLGLRRPDRVRRRRHREGRNHRRGRPGLRRARLPLDGLARRPRLPRRQERARPAAAVEHLVPRPPDQVRGVPRRRRSRTPLAPGIGLPGRVAATGRPAWIVDVTCDANFPRAEAGAEVGLRGAFSFPIPIGDKTFAVIECFSLQAVTPDDRLLEVTAHIGRQLGRQIAGQQLGDALRESENRFRSVAESATDAIVAADQNGDIISWNRGAELMFGHAEDDVVGKALSILMPERFRPMHDAGIKRVAEGGMAAARLIGQTVEVVGLRKDGREFPLELSLAMWETAGKRFFSGIIRDISERKKAEEKLKAVLETAPDPIVEVDHDGTIGFANARTDKLFGYDREQILGRPVEELFAERTRTLVAERFAAVLASTARATRRSPSAWASSCGASARTAPSSRSTSCSRCCTPTTASSSPASSATSRSASASRTSCSTWPTTTR